MKPWVHIEKLDMSIVKPTANTEKKNYIKQYNSYRKQVLQN
jgi:hypothetical protein